MSPHRHQPLRDERGFTLVEVLVTMSVALVVLFAILGAADIFGKSVTTVSNAAGAQDSARTTVRSMVATLRQARFAPGQTSPVPAAWTPSRSSLTIAAYVPAASGTGTERGWVRYCTVTSGTQSSLIMGVRAGDAYLAPGACSATDTTNGWTHAVLLDRTLQNPGQLFDFSASTCAVSPCLPAGPAVQSVGIRLAVGTSRESAGTFSSVVRDAVSFRNRSGS
ncbi:MAG: prepilin-type N-terminal cleavage/methylation domain-containing protein [Solirubrobacteraceae bacterium]|nr:prepilin-type N-terminal cleavage/methylation domain-containing protein [Solirubrobacteraceae bacterium]